MKTVAKIPKKGAACLQQTAEKTKTQKALYRTLPVISSLKIQIGQLLLSLQNQSEPQGQWQVFESELRRYIDLKFREVNS